MIQVYPRNSRYHVDQEWLKSNFSFSFGEYFDEANTGFGPLRVFNDDTIGPRKGFGAHPHSDMEIVTIVQSGKLRHEDNLGNVAVTGFGEVQRMSAGTGVIHTEANPSNDEAVSLLQLWFMPETRGLVPSYETSWYDPEQLGAALTPIVSREGGANAARIHQDMTIYMARPGAGEQVQFEQPSGRRIYVFVLEGSLEVATGDRAKGEGIMLQSRDSARITETPRLMIKARQGSSYILIDLP